MRLIRFLNSAVEKEVTANKSLFVAWCLMFNDYHEDEDPFHNQWWVENARLEEAERLQKLKNKIVDLCDEWEDIKSC